MTGGTSQGLFVVVAIVIFGIFVGLTYTLFGSTLKPALVNLFEIATEQSQESLIRKEHVNFIPDSNFEDETLTYSYVDARNSERAVDKEVLHNGKNTLRTSYTKVSEENEDGLFHDTIIWLRDDTFKNAIPEDTLFISFYAKANKDVKLISRLGGSYLQENVYSNLKKQSISTEWTKITYAYAIERGYTVPSEPAFIYWVDNTDTQTEVWISDLKVSLNSVFIELDK